MVSFKIKNMKKTILITTYSIVFLLVFGFFYVIGSGIAIGFMSSSGYRKNTDRKDLLKRSIYLVEYKNSESIEISQDGDTLHVFVKFINTDK